MRFHPGIFAASIVNASNTQLAAWTLLNSMTFTSVTRDANEAITTASVVWPDGSTGMFTTDAVSSVLTGAIDAYHITYIPSVGTHYTVTQPAVTRNAQGSVIAQPQLIIA